MVHSAEIICEVDIAYDCGPHTHTMLPAVAMNGDVGVIFPRRISRCVYSPAHVLLLVDFDSEVDHLVVDINFDTASGLHDFLILREHHVLSEVIPGVELGKVVAGYLVGVEVCSGDADDILVLALVGRLVAAVHVHGAGQLLVLVVLVHLLVVVDHSRLFIEGESDDPELIRGDVKRDDIIKRSVKLAHAEDLVSIENN